MTASLDSVYVWYLMRATGVVSLVLLTIVMVLGIGTVRRWRPPSAPGFVTAGVHRSVSLLSVVFVAIHVATAVIDPYAAVSIVSTVVPFVGSGNPLWVGLGAVSLDLVAALVVSSLIRRRLGARTWRAVHWAAYLCWPVAMAHGLGIGSDGSTVWMRGVVVASFASLGLAIGSRLLSGRGARPAGLRLAPSRR